MGCPWNSPGQNTGVGSLSLLWVIFPTQRSNPGLPHCTRILYQLSYQGSNAEDLGLIPGLGRAPDKGKATHSSGNGECSLVKSLGLLIFWGLTWCLSGKESACNVGDLGSILGSGKFPGGGHGNPLQYSCLENPMDREAWWATVHRVT